MSLHWSLTQFTPSTQNIAPQNAPERCFAIVVLLAGLMTLSSFVSGVTNAVQTLRKLTGGRCKEARRSTNCFHSEAIIPTRQRPHEFLLPRTLLHKRACVSQTSVSCAVRRLRTQCERANRTLSSSTQATFGTIRCPVASTTRDPCPMHLRRAQYGVFP